MWSVGNGEHIRIREDNWLKRGIIGGPATRDEPKTVVGLIHENEDRWNETKLQELFDETTVQEILTIPIKPQATQDQLVWTGTKSGAFTVKSRYNTMREKEAEQQQKQSSSSFQSPHKLRNQLWGMQTSTKIKIFTWSLCQNAIPSKEKPRKRQIIPEQNFPLCKREAETTEHSFLLCPRTKQVWLDPSLNLQISRMGLTRIDTWLLKFTETKANLPSLEHVATVLWHIWKARNNSVFRRQIPDPRCIPEEVQVARTNFSKWSPNLNQNEQTSRKKPIPT